MKKQILQEMIGSTFKELRISKGYNSIEEFGIAASRSISTISELENGRTGLTFSKFYYFCNILHIHPKDFFILIENKLNYSNLEVAKVDNYPVTNVVAQIMILTNTKDEELATKTFISTSTIQSYRLGRINVSLPNFLIIALALNIKPSSLFSYDITY